MFLINISAFCVLFNLKSKFVYIYNKKTNNPLICLILIVKLRKKLQVAQKSRIQQNN
ncbi:hypothetical protein SAMN02787100_2539 [Chryseobacterium sp. OV279]|nr:hypothetical protein SAMN02787100_2539 [Chryseobacterium sp. OV279]